MRPNTKHTSLYRKTPWLLFFAWVIMGSSYGQQLPLLHIGLKEGLPQSSVLRMKQDHMGYMWFATQGGLCRYDGTHFKVYSQFDGIASNYVRDIEFDKDGMMWVSTIDKGISCFNGRKFINFNSSTGLLTDQTRRFLKTKSGDYIICSVDKGVICADSYMNQRVILSPEGDTILYARDAIELDNGNVWIAHGYGIIELVKSKDYAPRHILKGENEMIRFYKDVKGDIWAGGTNTIIEYTKDTLTDYSYLVPANTDVWDILEESTTGKMYFATGVGLMIKYRNDITWLTTFNGLMVNDLRSLYKDRNGHLWTGTLGGGVTILENKGIDHFTYTENIKRFAANTITEDGDGNIWIGTNSDGVIYTDKKQAYISPYVSASDMQEVMTSTRDKETGAIWMAEYTGKIVKIMNKKVVWRFKSNEKTLRLLNISHHKGKLYIATQKGFYVLSEKENKLTKIEELGEAYYSYSFFDADDNLWVLADDGKIIKYKNGKITDYTNLINPTHASTTQGIYDPYRKIYWFCTYSGLMVTNLKYVHHLHSKNGLLSDSPWSIAQDHHGDIWLGHPNGIERINYKTRSSKSFGYDQGFTPIETNSCASYCDQQGNIWFGTVSSATRIRVNDISMRKSIVNLCIQKIWVNEKLEYEEDLMHHSKEKLVLSWRKNNITLDLMGICFENAKDVTYSWSLQGFDKKWTKWDNNTRAIYSNLRPGTYIFKAKAKDPNGYETQPVSLKIIIKKPVWNYWWFYVIEVAIMAIIIYLSFAYSADPYKNKLGNILTLVSILIIFEGLLIYVSDYVNDLTAGIPIFQLIMNVILAGSLHPLEQLIRKFMRRYALKQRKKKDQYKVEN